MVYIPSTTVWWRIPADFWYPCELGLVMMLTSWRHQSFQRSSNSPVGAGAAIPMSLLRDAWKDYFVLLLKSRERWAESVIHKLTWLGDSTIVVDRNLRVWNHRHSCLLTYTRGHLIGVKFVLRISEASSTTSCEILSRREPVTCSTYRDRCNTTIVTLRRLNVWSSLLLALGS